MRDEAEHKGDSEAVGLGVRRCREAGGLKLLLIGGPKFLGYALIEAALARGHEVTTFNRGQTNPGLSSASRATGSNAATNPAIVRCRSGARRIATFTCASTDTRRG